MNKKLLLETVLKLKGDLEHRDIKELQGDIVKYFNTEKNVETLQEILKKKEAQLIILKEVIQEANQGTHKNGKTNNYQIYQLSILKFRKEMIQELIQKHDPKVSQISIEQLNKDLRENLSEAEKISSSLTTFNRDTYVKVELDESLNLLN